MTKTDRPAFFKTDDPLFGYSVDMLLIGVSLLIMGTFLGGIMAVYQAAVCVFTAAVCEYVGFKLVTKSNPLGDLSAFWVGLIISLMLPSSAPLWLGAMASAFAVLVVKLPFGGTRNAPFVPAAAGISFAWLCFPELMSAYPASSSGLSAVFSTSEGFTKGTSLLSMLSSGKSVDLNIFGRSALLTGTFPAAIGTSCMLAMIGVTLYILIRRPSRLYSSLGYVLAAALFAALFPRVNSGFISSIVLELCAGSLMFTALLLVNDPVTSPKMPLSSFAYGAAAGLICMLLRRYAKIEDPSCFSVMIINAVWPVLSSKTATDQAAGKKKSYALKRAARLDKLSAKKGAENTSADTEKDNAEETALDISDAPYDGGDGQ